MILRAALPKPRESQVLAAVLKALAYHPAVAFAFRTNTGAVRFEGKTGDRFVKFGTAGWPDITGMLKGGRLLAVECKQPGKKLTAKQRMMQSLINDSGGCAFTAWSVDDVRKNL